MSSTADSTDDEPLPSPPSISFDPSLHTQRQSAVHDLLRRISSTPRFHGQLTRLLDVGCGEGQILQRLSPCDDSLPLQAMTGIDIDAAHAASHTWSTLGAAPSDDRWSPLNLTLLHGSFENMLPANVGYHDVIVSVEGALAAPPAACLHILTNMPQSLSTWTQSHTRASPPCSWGK